MGFTADDRMLVDAVRGRGVDVRPVLWGSSATVSELGPELFFQLAPEAADALADALLQSSV